MQYASAYAGHAQKALGLVHVWASFLELGQAAARMISFEVDSFKVRHWLDRTLRSTLPSVAMEKMDPDVEVLVENAGVQAKIRNHDLMDEEHLLLAFLLYAYENKPSEILEAFEAVELIPSYHQIKERRLIEEVQRYLDDPRFPFDSLSRWKGMTSFQLVTEDSWEWLQNLSLKLPSWLSWIGDPLAMIHVRHVITLSYAYYRHGAHLIWPDDGGRGVPEELLVKR